MNGGDRVMNGGARTSTSSLDDSFVVYNVDDADYGPQDTPTQAPSPTFPPRHVRESPLLDTRRAAYAASPLLSKGAADDYGGNGELEDDLEADGDAVDDGTGQTTLNKGSEGRGGWRMLGSGPGGVSRFEPLTWTEIVAMSVRVGQSTLITQVG